MNQSQTFQRPIPIPDDIRKPPRLQVYMPATPPLGLIATAEFWFRIYWRRRHFRRQFLPLLERTDQILEDLGFNREDIRWALSLPVRVNALKALAACRKARQLYNAERMREAEMPQNAA